MRCFFSTHLWYHWLLLVPKIQTMLLLKFQTYEVYVPYQFRVNSFVYAYRSLCGSFQTHKKGISYLTWAAAIEKTMLKYLCTVHCALVQFFTFYVYCNSSGTKPRWRCVQLCIRYDQWNFATGIWRWWAFCSRISQLVCSKWWTSSIFVHSRWVWLPCHRQVSFSPHLTISST